METSSVKRFLVYASAGDKTNLQCWLENGPRAFDLWVTYYGSQADDPPWARSADLFRRRKGGKFENLAALCREEPRSRERLLEYDAVFVTDDDVVIDAPRINRLFEVSLCSLFPL